MPLYSNNTNLHPGARPWPCSPVFGEDADGNCIGDCEAVNTDTGECWYFMLNDDGGPIKVQGPDGFARYKIFRVLRRGPIRLFNAQKGRVGSEGAPVNLRRANFRR